MSAELKPCPFCGATPLKTGNWITCVPCAIHKATERLWNNRPDSPGSEYASVELLGHIDLQACKVREIDDLGGKALEVTALNKDGSDGKVQIVSPAAIYRRHVLTKEEALKDAATRWRQSEPIETPPHPINEPMQVPVFPRNEVERIATYCKDVMDSPDILRDAEEVLRWLGETEDSIPF